MTMTTAIHGWQAVAGHHAMLRRHAATKDTGKAGTVILAGTQMPARRGWKIARIVRSFCKLRNNDDDDRSSRSRAKLPGEIPAVTADMVVGSVIRRDMLKHSRRGWEDRR